MRDRIVQYPARFQLTPVAGQSGAYDLAAVPGAVTEAGTPINKANLLTDTTAAALGLNPANNPSVNDALAALRASQSPHQILTAAWSETVGNYAAKVLPHTLGRIPVRTKVFLYASAAAQAPFGAIVEITRQNAAFNYVVCGSMFQSSHAFGIWDKSLVNAGGVTESRAGAPNITLGYNLPRIIDIVPSASDITFSFYAGTLNHTVKVEVYG